MHTRVLVRVPDGFSLRTAIHGHGWFDLPPFFVRGEIVLERVLLLDRRAIDVRISAKKGGLRVEANARADREALARVARHMLRLDEDFAPLYALTDEDPALAWARAAGAGRLLRAPAIFEDVVKMLLTTNCSWSLTRVMVERLVGALGEPAPSGRRAFPTAARMARENETFYRDVVRAGYRAPHLVKIARDVARGALDLESLHDEPDPERVRDRLLALPGIGPYAADNLLRLVGAYGYLGLDSWCRARIRKLFPRARDVDAFARRRWRRYGRFRGLAMWLELTAHWHRESPPSLAP